MNGRNVIIVSIHVYAAEDVMDFGYRKGSPRRFCDIEVNAKLGRWLADKNIFSIASVNSHDRPKVACLSVRKRVCDLRPASRSEASQCISVIENMPPCCLRRSAGKE